MQEKKNKSIIARLNDIFSNDTSPQKLVRDMRPLSDEELRTVAGGPEVEVGNGN